MLAYLFYVCLVKRTTYIIQSVNINKDKLKFFVLFMNICRTTTQDNFRKKRNFPYYKEIPNQCRQDNKIDTKLQNILGELIFPLFTLACLDGRELTDEINLE